MFESSSDYRVAARAFLRGRWQTAMLVTFFSTIIGTVASVVMTFITPTLYEQLISLLYEEIKLEEFAGIVWESCALPIKIMAGLFLLEILVGEVLSLGRISFFENIAHGKPASCRDIISRFGIFGKSIGLRLYIALKILLWVLPGLALYTGLMFLVMTKEVSTVEEVNFLLSLVSILEVIGLGAMMVPGIIAYLRYCMSPYMMAQIPSAGIRACVAKSKELMNGRKKTYCLMLLGFLGWLLLVELLSSFVANISYPLYVVCYLFASLALTVYMEMAKAVFYMRLTGQIEMHKIMSRQNINQQDEGE